MNFVDTHCHIQSLGTTAGEPHTRKMWSRAKDLTVKEVLTDAQAAGVTKMICVGCTLEDSELAIQFAADKPGCYASIGIHPHEAENHLVNPGKLPQFQDLLEKNLSNPKLVAIGEIGLDYYYEHSPKAAQKELFRFQLELAHTHGLPVIFHVRDAFDDFWPIFDEFPVRGVIHSFSTTQKVLDQINQRDLYIGLNGIMTFTNDGNQLAAAREVPLDRLVLETDAPFLTPTPYRGTICQPKHVVDIARFLSDLRQEPLETMADATTKNALQLFKLQEQT